jgi:hypothetical protein
MLIALSNGASINAETTNCNHNIPELDIIA